MKQLFDKVLPVDSIVSFLYVLLLLAIPVVANDQVQIRYLKPPKLEKNNWGKQILCHRPMRRGSPNMSIVQDGATVIVNNYGHGGSGWTLAPGCAKYVTSQFSQLVNNLQTPIVIIGAGVLGLFSAYELIRLGYTSITIIAGQFDNLASHKAGGFLAPSTMEVDTSMTNIVDAICFDAYCFYAQIARAENQDFPSSGASIMPIYLKRDDSRLQAYEGIVMHKPQDVIIDFGNDKTYEMKVYDDGIYMDTSVMMNSLTAFLRDKVRWIQRQLTSLDEVDATCIFNCAGLGAQQLNNDDAMVSVQGHLILLEDQNPVDMNYMISLHVESEVTQDGASIKRSIYMFPKHVPGSSEQSIGVVGGTFIENATNDTPHEQEFGLLIERAREFFGA